MRAATLKESAHHATHMPDYQAIDVSRNGAVARIAFDRPDAYNTLDERMAEEMVTAAQQLVSDDDVRCLVVTGNGPVFNTGADLGGLAGDGSDEQRLRSLAGRLHEFVGQLLRAPKRADSAASTMSPQSAGPRPPPAATPLTPVTTGTGARSS